MTMINPCEKISRENLIRRSTSVYGFGLGDYDSNFNLLTRLDAEDDDEYYVQRDNSYVLGSDLAIMAEDESRTGSINETGSSSKDNNNDNTNHKNHKEDHKEEEEDEEEKGWLQLSIGGRTYMPTSNKPEENSRRSPGGSGLVELDLLPTISSQQGKSTVHINEFRAPPLPPPRRYQQQFLTTTSATTASTTSSSLFLQQYPGMGVGSSSTNMFPQQQQEIINWGFRTMTAPIQQNMNLSLVSSGSHFGPGPFPVLEGVPGPNSIDFRVVHPPRRPHSGLWFSLQPSLNQTKEPFLPQLSKSYLRIKDGRMTLRLVLKYLVNKLQLENESEIEITCRGQQLQPFLTLQHVRDHIWSTTTNAADNILTLLPSETSNHVMVLHYARTSAPQN